MKFEQQFVLSFELLKRDLRDVMYRYLLLIPKISLKIQPLVEFIEQISLENEWSIEKLLLVLCKLRASVYFTRFT